VTYARGKMTAHDVPGICQAGGTKEVERIIMAAITRNERSRASLNRFTILGTSIQKLDLSTSYGVRGMKIDDEHVYIQKKGNSLFW